ncbi:peptidoglycan editing factor PgeF [Aquirufa sp. ROCK-SH2]
MSTRKGGVSPFPFDSLNLGVHTPDTPENIQHNLLGFTEKLDIPFDALARSYQCHGDQILVTDSPIYAENFDAIITNTLNVFPGVGIADCCPILLADPVHQVAAAIHAGWKGTVKEIVRKTVEKMQGEFQTNPNDILAYIGPCISQEFFEVGDEVAEQFSAEVKVKIKDKFHVDLKKANAIQLQNAGVKQIEISPLCTIKNNDLFFSFRKENGSTGRMLAVIGFK